MVEILKNILFIDDDLEFLRSIRRMIIMEKYPWQVYTQSSPEEVLAMSNLSQMDIVLTDLLMPGFDGFWLIQKMKAVPELASIPIIVITGNGEEGLKRQALKLGATDLLNKPFHPDDLFMRIQNSLMIKEYQDELKRRNKVLQKEVARRTAQVEAARIEIIWKLARAGEFRDEETGNHVFRVGYISEFLARCLGLRADEVELIFLTSPLHDIGKIGVPDAILRKPGRLTELEMAEIRLHCQYGRTMLLDRSKYELKYFADFFAKRDLIQQTGLLSNPFMEKAAEIAYTHHENWDGTGYPQHISGNHIPIAGRIVSIVDTYDALRSNRPYKLAYPADQTVEMIRSLSGTRFDPEITAIFLAHIQEIDRIWQDFQV